jgi:lipopolysaccharide export system protein LptA
MSRLRRISSSLVPPCGGLVTLALGLLLAAPVFAQTLTNSFGGLSKSSKDPIDIESDVLVVHDSQKYATFKGNVKAVQGTTTLRARALDVHYTGGGDKLLTGQDQNQDKKEGGGEQAAVEAKPADAKDGKGASADSGTQITQIEAKGDVIITSENDQTTSSEWAIYDVPSQQVTVGGNVVLTQGKNVLKGDRLVIDLKTGESRFENPGNTATAGGRIRALFMPKDEGADTAKSGEKASGEAAAAAPKPAGETSDSTPGTDDESAASSASAATPKSNKPVGDSPWQIVPSLPQ